MKKNILIIILTCITYIVNAQSADYDVTAPSVSSLASYINSPSKNATGIPDIDIPLTSLPSHLKKININIGLSYHPNNTLADSKASDVGLGWTLFGTSNTIYRENNSGTLNNNYIINLFGKVGKFYFSKKTDGTHQYAKIIEDQLKVTFEEISPELYHFKIIDENGYKYYFETLDQSNYLYHPQNFSPYNKPYTSCYYLTKVENEKGNEMLTFEYLADEYTEVLDHYKSLKIKKIISKDFGSINFSYTLDPNERKTFRDPFRLDMIQLKDNNGNQIEKYILQSSLLELTYPKKFDPSVAGHTCGMVDVLTKRRLDKIVKYGRGTNYETTEIKYPAFSNNNFDVTDYWAEYSNIDPLKVCFKNESENPKYLGIGLLSSIKFPNGSEVKYTFEPNQYYVDKSDPEYKNLQAPPYELKDRDAQYFQDIAVIPFDYHNTNGAAQFGQFTLTTNPDESDGYSYLFTNLYIDELYTDSPFQPVNGNYVVNLNMSSGVNDANGYKKYPPGVNPYTISGTGGRGTIVIKRIRYKSLPMENYSTGKGLRIKKIEYLENNAPLVGLTTNYSYQKFDGTNKTSGYLNENVDEETVVYENIKETTGQNKGFIKYYYRTLHDIKPPSQDTLILAGTEVRCANLLKNGLLEKEEVYNANNALMKKNEIISYILPLNNNIYSTYPFPIPKVIFGQYYETVRNGIIQNQKVISTFYNPSAVTTETSEITRDIDDFNIVYKKNTESSGKITETFITYPWVFKTVDPRLWNAHIINIPVITETKVNGITVNKSEIKFDDSAHYNPTSELSGILNTASGSQTNITYDRYDSNNKLLQYTTKAGVPVSIIWGYNNTQPIAKVEGVAYSQLESLGLISAIVSASDSDASNPSNEGALITALDSFRNNSSLSGYQVSTYSYDPLIGITSITPPSGIREVYFYDSANRLEKIVDVNGKVLKELKYNYKN
ncbi:MAG: hypothetical protein P0Y62_01760 [Candidatus Chryseobacterium colombiense]|nr:hypothetical protein [Chryseobacterium sp.]WEK70281.1 MAG: hypothetical protein P0Y62_01760 [Chryseobacterium sp.]